MRSENLRPVEFDGHWYSNIEVRSNPKIQGYFHRWGEKFYGNIDERGAAIVVGVVEAEDGRIYEVPVENMRFVD